jgi:hypothetical protein
MFALLSFVPQVGTQRLLGHRERPYLCSLTLDVSSEIWRRAAAPRGDLPQVIGIGIGPLGELTPPGGIGNEVEQRGTHRERHTSEVLVFRQ